jgi:hypothetical protein
MHVHAGVIEFLTTAAYVLIFSYLWRAAAAQLANTTAGKAMAAVFS